jgi:hypothetical protein
MDGAKRKGALPIPSHVKNIVYACGRFEIEHQNIFKSVLMIIKNTQT